MKKITIIICAIITVIMLGIFALVLYSYHSFNKSTSRYAFAYKKYGLDFEGKFIHGEMEYDKIILNPKNVFCKAMILQFDNQKYKLGDLAFKDMEQMKAERDEYRNVISYRIHSHDGFNPPYLLTIHYINNVIHSFLYSIQNPPDPNMREPKIVPIALIFPDGFHIVLPIKQSVVEKRFGKPDSTRHYRRGP